MSILGKVETELFGERNFSMSVRYGPLGGEDRLDDMAQAWIEGRHDEVNAWVADREARVRAVIVEVPCPRVRNRRDRGRGIRAWGPYHPIINRTLVLKLRRRGWKLSRIAKLLKCSTSQVSLICRSATRGLYQARAA